MKKLPKIYQNEINKTFTNNETVYYSKTHNQKTTNKTQDKETIQKILTELREEKGFLFNKPLLITTNNKEYDTAIVYITKENITTLSEDTIKIEDIQSIIRK